MTPALGLRSTGFTQGVVLDWHDLRENPFAGTPNPKYLYESPTHAEAKSSLFVGLECGVGFQALIAPPGMGKTTILFDVIEKFNDLSRIAFLFQPRGDYREVLRYVLLELGGKAGHDLQDIQQRLNQLLLREHAMGQRTIVVVDEAQSLDAETLETLRLLSNFETPSEKLLQIVLAGQPQLANNLAAPGLRQLHQRISILKTLAPLDIVETENYIRHRLYVAGHSGGTLFTPAAVTLIWQTSHGIPREINTLCFNALLLSAALRKKQIDESTLHEVIADRNTFELSERIVPNPSLAPSVQVPREVNTADAGSKRHPDSRLSTADLNFYSLKLNPFDPVPDPSFLCLTSTHWHALASIYTRVMKRQGPVILTGAPGSGKSLVVSCVMKLLRSNNVNVGYVASPEALALHVRRVAETNTNGAKTSHLSNAPHADAEVESTLFIDEMENLDARGWRELQSFVTRREGAAKRVVLVGRCEIENVLNTSELAKLKHAIVFGYGLDDLRDREIQKYITCHVGFVQTDCETAPVFRQDAISALTVHSHGNPGALNCLCEAALAKAHVHGQRNISASVVDEIALEPRRPATSGERIPRHHPRFSAELLKAAGVLLDLHLALHA